MRIYIICSVRDGTDEAVFHYVEVLRAQGHEVHFPPDSVDQNDPVGTAICGAHYLAMQAADEVHIFWDVRSYGSHFDLGMAFALGKKFVPVKALQPDGEGKSYWKVINACAAYAA